MNYAATGFAKDRLLLLNRLLILRAVVLCSILLIVAGGTIQQFNAKSSLWLALLISASAAYSVYVWFHYCHKGHTITNNLLAAQLIWDSVIILILVWLSGRSTNPFIYYLLVVIAISASIFSQRIVWLFCFSGIFAYSFLLYLDINQHITHITADFRSHLVGMWINFVGSALLISFFITRLTAALRNSDRSLALAREKILKNEQLIGIGTLAASTVHSFGTPLSTIAMSVAEIDALHSDSETSECTNVINAQITRCKQTMAKLSNLASQNSSTHPHITLEKLVEEIREHFLLTNAQPMPEIVLVATQEETTLPEGLLLKHAIINLIDNAVHAAKSLVHIKFEVHSKGLQILIEDDGDGVAPEVLDVLGETVVTSKPTGMGIGFLLANSTFEQLNGQVHFSNPDPKNGVLRTRVSAQIPLLQTSGNP